DGPSLKQQLKRHKRQQRSASHKPPPSSDVHEVPVPVVFHTSCGGFAPFFCDKRLGGEIQIGLETLKCGCTRCIFCGAGVRRSVVCDLMNRTRHARNSPCLSCNGSIMPTCPPGLDDVLLHRRSGWKSMLILFAERSSAGESNDAAGPSRRGQLPGDLLLSR